MIMVVTSVNRQALHNATMAHRQVVTTAQRFSSLAFSVYTFEEIASCLLDKLSEMANTGYNAYRGYEYRNDSENI
ncbi:hypothetical protein HBI81_246020 [Parastagonospora nodorum]|nr:hypothetical protein HBH52_074110 [Parastagonospora nodorum]KAH4082893.1 hypothetical protein HBH46_219940 [Parastagonospora nodorum]KAH5483861.1 hypothetical protein HBI31_174190 [Parastagonospora nodorum]KAH5711450.1 hypothetical protein HBI18_219780 [Parastagonospora nodorum]KAH5728898.1 hypothetical protein HBI17_225510 [Parastagonospora nodorum]